MGRGKVWTDHEVQPPRGSADRLLSLWAIHGDVQPHPFHPGRPAADHYLGHQDWHEEARLPLRDTIHLAHTQVSINDVFCFLIMNLIKFAWHSWTLKRYWKWIFFVCRWSNDGSYFGRITPDTLSVYETPVSTLQIRKIMWMSYLKSSYMFEKCHIINFIFLIF